MKKKIIIGASVLVLILASITVIIFKDSLFGSKPKPSPEPKRKIVLTDKEKAVEILSKKLKIDKSKFVYAGETDEGELIYTNKDNNDKKNDRYIINIETENYRVEQELNFGSAEKKNSD